jgi:myo-inositol-1(or 4)-monophosphatase
MSYLDVAIVAAKRAGRIHKKYFQTDIQVDVKSSPFDLVTTADLEAEKEIVSSLKSAFADHNFLAEENKYPKTNSEFTWVIDPLDGTNNFAAGLPIFCVSIGLVRDGQILVGVIYDSTRDELFCAEKSKGAFLNGRRIRVSSKASLSESVLITGFYYDRGEEMSQTLENIRKFFLNPVTGLRRLGAAALDLAYIASGRASGFWEFCLSPWDFTAGKLMVEEAGGKVTDRLGKDVDISKKSYIVASNGKIHDQMLAILK